ncbi:hypothetical protein KCU71_g6417, partial [Aureobasidium melanogenum]
MTGRNLLSWAADYGIFHYMVLHDELSRISTGPQTGLAGASSIGAPPILAHGTETQKDAWLPGIFIGEFSFCFGATELIDGSGLANLLTTAQKTPDGQYYIVNGQKKWITGAISATHMTTAVRTGGSGVQSKPLFSNQVIRHKLAKVAKDIEAHWAWIEQIAYHVKVNGWTDDVASHIAMAKIFGGRMLELACREAQQVLGGAGYQRNGVGGAVEQISRNLRLIVVGGGSEEIIGDLAVRHPAGARADATEGGVEFRTVKQSKMHRRLEKKSLRPFSHL